MCVLRWEKRKPLACISIIEQTQDAFKKQKLDDRYIFYSYGQVIYMYRGARLLRTTLNADIEVIPTKPADPAWPTRYTKPGLIRTMISIPDKNALPNMSVLSGQLCMCISLTKAFSPLVFFLFPRKKRLKFNLDEAFYFFVESPFKRLFCTSHVFRNVIGLELSFAERGWREKNHI